MYVLQKKKKQGGGNTFVTLQVRFTLIILTSKPCQHVMDRMVKNIGVSTQKKNVYECKGKRNGDQNNI